MMSADSPAPKTALADVVDERAESLIDAVGMAQTALCTILDGPQEYHYRTAVEDYERAVSAVRAEWQTFTAIMASAQHLIEGRTPDG